MIIKNLAPEKPKCGLYLVNTPEGLVLAKSLATRPCKSCEGTGHHIHDVGAACFSCARTGIQLAERTMPIEEALAIQLFNSRSPEVQVTALLNKHWNYVAIQNFLVQMVE